MKMGTLFKVHIWTKYDTYQREKQKLRNTCSMNIVQILFRFDNAGRFQKGQF